MTDSNHEDRAALKKQAIQEIKELRARIDNGEHGYTVISLNPDTSYEKKATIRP